MRKIFAILVLFIIFFADCHPIEEQNIKPKPFDFSKITPSFPVFIDTVNIVGQIPLQKKDDYDNFLSAQKFIFKWKKFFRTDYKFQFFILKNLKDLNFTYFGNNAWSAEKKIADDNLNTYNVKVFATVKSDEIDWEIFVSVNEAKEFKFLDGKTDSLTSEWTLYKHTITSSREILKINRNSENNIDVKKFIILDSLNSFYRNKFTFRHNDSKFSFSVENIDSNRCFGIDTTYHYGVFKTDSIQLCWDSVFRNTYCDSLPSICDDF